MRAECYLTSNGCFARADQLRSINNRRRRKRKEKKGRKSRFRASGSPRMNPAQLPRKDRVGVRRVVLGHPSRLSRSRGKDRTEIDHTSWRTASRGVQVKKHHLPPPSFASPFPIFGVNREGRYPAISDSSLADCYARRNKYDLFVSKE